LFLSALVEAGEKRRAHLSEPNKTAKPRVCLLCLSVIKDDPRVRKQGDLLHAAGFTVTGVGLAGGSAPAPAWPVLATVFTPASSLPARLAKLARQPVQYGRYLVSMGLRPLALSSPRFAEWLYWQRPAFRTLFEAARNVAADVYVANDWNMLPIAHELVAIHGGRFVYDSHEYAAEELPESRAWRLLHRDLAIGIERKFIHEAAFVSTVSWGIAILLRRDHRLADEPMVMRNVPRARPPGIGPSPLRQEGEITVLFHGGISEHRGLHILVESVRLWRSGRKLVLRGPVGETYRRRLEAIIDTHGLRERVTIEPPVPSDRLIEAAANADVGIVCLPDSSAENRFALPNKIFEYVSAGLALLVPDLAELADLTVQYGIGRIFPRLTAEAIAASVNALEMTAVNAFKERARVAATELVWEREAEPWLKRIEKLVAAGDARPDAKQDR
jgi:glycosyltransferase involved in cell wall biosynthesis